MFESTPVSLNLVPSSEIEMLPARLLAASALLSAVVTSSCSSLGPVTAVFPIVALRGTVTGTLSICPLSR